MHPSFRHGFENRAFEKTADDPAATKINRGSGLSIFHPIRSVKQMVVHPLRTTMGVAKSVGNVGKSMAEGLGYGSHLNKAFTGLSVIDAMGKAKEMMNPVRLRTNF